MSDGTIRREHRFSVVPEHLIRDARISDRAFRLWCILDRYAGANEIAFPSRDTLHEDLQCSIASVDRSVVELVENGWLSKDRRYPGGPNDYVVLVASTGTPVLTGEDRGVLTGEERVSSPVTGGVLTGEETKKEASVKEASEKDPHSVREPRKRGTRLPDDWEVPDSARAWFSEQAWSRQVNPREETDAFKDYWRARPGQGGVKLDWEATWRNWMRSAAKRLRPGQPPTNRDTATDQMALDMNGRTA